MQVRRLVDAKFFHDFIATSFPEIERVLNRNQGRIFQAFGPRFLPRHIHQLRSQTETLGALVDSKIMEIKAIGLGRYIERTTQWRYVAHNRSITNQISAWAVFVFGHPRRIRRAVQPSPDRRFVFQKTRWVTLRLDIKYLGHVGLSH